MAKMLRALNAINCKLLRTWSKLHGNGRRGVSESPSRKKSEFSFYVSIDTSSVVEVPPLKSTTHFNLIFFFLYSMQEYDFASVPCI